MTDLIAFYNDPSLKAAVLATLAEREKEIERMLKALQLIAQE